MPKSETKVTDNVNPRVRMKEIRSLIAGAIKDGNRIDKMSFNKADTARVMIALQDANEESIQAHNRATKHVMDTKQKLIFIANLSTMTIEDATAKAAMQQSNIISLSKQCENFSNNLKDANQDVFELQKLLTTTEEQLSSALTTLQTVMGDAHE